MSAQEVFLSLLTAVAVLFATFAVLSGSERRSAYCAWICGLSVGAIFLGYGAEFLAFAQWILSTLIASMFVLYSVIFGESKPDRVERSKLRGLVFLSFVGLTASFVLDVWPITQIRTEAGSVFLLGKRMVEDYFLALLMLGFMLFLVIIGAGVIARPERSEK